MKEISFKRMVRLWLSMIMCIIVLFLITIFGITGVNAESGTITIADTVTTDNNRSGIAGGIVGNIEYIAFDNANYNQIAYLEVISSDLTFTKVSGTSKFYCISVGDTCTGTFVYTQSSKKLQWWFDDTSYLNLSTNQIRVAYNTSTMGAEVNENNWADGGAANSTYPAGVSWGANHIAGGIVGSYIRTIAVVKSSVTNRWNVTYTQIDSDTILFSTFIDKYQASVNTQIHINGTNTNYFSEPTSNKVNFTNAVEYVDGITLKFLLSSGEYGLVVVNTTNAEDTDIYGNITTDKNLYNKTENINISYNITNADGRIVLTGKNFPVYYSVVEGINQYRNVYIDDLFNIGQSNIILQYYESSNNTYIEINRTSINISTPNNSSINILNDNYNLGDTLYISYISNHTGFVHLNDSQNNIILNYSVSSLNSFDTISFYLDQNQNTGTWTANLINDTSGLIVDSDTSIINFNIVTSNVTPSPVTTSTGLIDIIAVGGEFVFGTVDSNDDLEYSDNEIKALGNKSMMALLFLAFLILFGLAYKKLTGK